jgi:peptidyl-prolyl cis-trans isomerase SurA
MKKVLLALLLAGVPTTLLAADIIQQILVKVNGEIITKTDLEERQVDVLRQRELQFDRSDLENDETLRQVLLEVTPRILANAIDELLLIQRGRELGYRLTDEQFQQILDNIKEENNIETDAQFQAALDQEGLTLEAFRAQVERQLIVSRVQQAEVMPRLSISEDEARSYYEGHIDEFTSKPTVTLREILVRVESLEPDAVNVAADEEARAKIEAVRTRLLAGEDFVTLVAEASDAASRANGGLIGPLNVDEINPTFLIVLDTMSPGDITEPIRTTQGYQLLKLESRTGAEVQPFEDARDLIADKVFEEKQRAEFEKYIAKLREQAIIEWKNEELKKLYDQYMQAAAASVSSQ